MTYSDNSVFEYSEHRARKAKQKETFNQVDEKFFRRPSTALFRQFCDELVSRYKLAKIVKKASVDRLEPLFDPAIADTDEDTDRLSEEDSDVDSDEADRLSPLKQKPSHFKLHLSDGSHLLARRVLLATGLNLSNIPEWAVTALAEHGQTVPARICHSDNLWITSASSAALYDKKVLVVGSGLSSCHLALTALSYNANKVCKPTPRLYSKFWLVDVMKNPNYSDTSCFRGTLGRLMPFLTCSGETEKDSESPPFFSSLFAHVLRFSIPLKLSLSCS